MSTDEIIQQLIHCDEFFVKMKHLIDSCLEDKIRTLEAKVVTLLEENKEIKNKYIELEKKNTALENKNNDLEQYGRRSNLRVFGLDKISVKGQNVESKKKSFVCSVQDLM
uniref:Uncharacterized protein n=1 Tax=Cacopsylla melanoneura TaxID=428564 RepID=A0A8D8V7V9_9HEMI